MSEKQPEISGLTIVLLGAFNPDIFHPSWFAAENLVRKGEADKATVTFVHPEIAIIEIGSFKLQIEKSRFLASTVDSISFDPLRDLVLGTFAILHHTPLRALGINFDSHFKMSSEISRQELGHRLAPKQHWDSLLQEPLLQKLVMKGNRPDDHDGYIQVSVEPSTKLPSGVYVHVNDHFDVKSSKKIVSACDTMEILEQCFNESGQRAQTIANGLVGY